MKLIMENWNKFISEDTLEEKQSGRLRSAKDNFRTKFRKAKAEGLPALEAFLANPPLNKMILNLNKGYTKEEKSVYEEYIKKQLEIH